MKKFLPALISLALLAAFVLPLVTSAAVSGPGECCKLRRAISLEGTTFPADSIVGETVGNSCTIGGQSVSITQGTNLWGIACLINTLNSVTDWIFTILVAVAMIMVIIGAMQFLMSAGDPEKTKSGRNYIMYALIGLVLAFLARAIPAVFKMVAGY